MQGARSAKTPGTSDATCSIFVCPNRYAAGATPTPNPPATAWTSPPVDRLLSVDPSAEKVVP